MQLLNHEAYGKSHEIGLAIGEAIALGRNPHVPRAKRRKEIKRRLAEIESNRNAIEELQCIIQRYENDLENAVARHQKLCLPLQGQLERASTEERVAIRERINQANDELKLESDAINKRIKAAKEEIKTLGVAGHGLPMLQNALLVTGDPDKLRELAVAKRHEKHFRNRLDALQRAVRDAEEEIEFGKSPCRREEPFTLKSNWLPRQKPESRWADSLIVEKENELVTLKLESSEVVNYYSAASVRCRKLEDEIRNE